MLEYKELDQLVRRYQDGDSKAAQEIIEHFDGFLIKFLNLIKNGRLDISDKSLRSFVGLYIKKPYVLKRLHAYYKYKDVMQEIFTRASWIQHMFKNYEWKEIHNELVCILLEMGQRYKLRDDGVYCFHTYIKKSFHFYVFRHLQKLISDPLTFVSNDIINYLDNDGDGTSQDYIEGLICDKQVNDHTEINENWINGVTCDEVFLKFNPVDRRILQMYYVYDMSDQKIANALGLCRATINRKRLAAKTYIKGHMSNE